MKKQPYIIQATIYFFKEPMILEVPQFFWGWRGTPEPSTVHALAARKKSHLS